MNDFLEKLFSYDNFALYLIIALIILVVLFIVVLFMGKKDKLEREIEATKKLEQINEDAFKEEEILNKLEIIQDENGMIQEQTILEDDTIILPTIENIEPKEKSEEIIIPEPVLPIEEVVSSVPTATDEDYLPEDNFTPILEQIEEKPIVVQEIMEDKKELGATTEADKQFEITREIPEFNFDEIMKSIEEETKQESKEEVKEEKIEFNRGPQIFSSVFVPEKKEEKVTTSDDIELPVLKKDVQEKEETVEIPLEDEKEPIVTDFNLDEIGGETYNIN